MSDSVLNPMQRTAPPAAQLPSGTQSIGKAIQLVGDDLAKVELQLKQLLQSSVGIIPTVGGHLAFAGGKRLRPLLTLLCARAAGVDSHQRLVVAAVGELLHTATLLHDDVIDHGEFRRGRPAARLPYGNGIAVLTGDYCLASGLQAVAELGDLDAVKSMAATVSSMAEGEIAQLHSAGDPNPTRDHYYMVIERKTAKLISWCTSVAGFTGSERSPALEEYGRELGYAFQIADDVLDYVGSNLGKANRQDLGEGKVTLPLILARERDANIRTKLEALLAKGPPVDPRASAEIGDLVDACGATEEALQVASAHAQKAAGHLDCLPDSPERTALLEICDFVVRRPS